ncbi:M23 family metallopeptidase [Alicyclobacillus fastidiosus]|uniref:M23 family metallopeptidase n=1 Tax=Alicyclobacillus fastidiosus TaxID=392011 RepID=A0ABV5AFS3_9BACL|nr:M23 family metallopeptidase [Alicyclobacillus fastidiosus]WEH11681.1 M23 family metallopeptidase [Alicyclobacillus fastidiosus]
MPDVKRKWPWQVKHTSAEPYPDERNSTSRADSEESLPAPSRWVSEEQSDLSPYGFAEEDAGLRQVESGAWRRAFSGSGQPRKQFVPMHAPKPTQRPAARPNRPSTLSRTMMWQALCALVLVGIVYYVDHHPDSVPPNVTAQTQAVLETDYTANVEPDIDKAFADMHLGNPTFGGSTAKLHAPLNGTVVDDYSSTHPEVWIAGAAKAPVMAAGSGTVLNVVKTGDTELVKIDNGAYGTTIYAGLGSVSVKPHEYVTAAQVIGKLPASPSHPSLKFSMVKNGQYVNPNTWIQLTGASQ